MPVERSPAEYFIRFLISKQEYEANTIVAICEDHQLEPVSYRYIEKLKNKMEPFPSPFEPVLGKNPKAHEATRAWLRKQHIHDLWYPNEPVQEAYRILGEPKVRENVEQLLLSSLKPEEIVRRLNAHHNIKLTADGVVSFGHYFWNKSLLSMAEWVEFMDGKPSAYQRITTMQASPDVADMVVPWLAGLSGPPPSISTGTVARRARDVAFLKILEIERAPATIVHSKMMKNYMDVIKAAEDEMRQSDVALKEVLAAFEKFRLKKDDKPVPSIEQIAGMNYSQSGGGSGDLLESDRLLEE